MIEADFPNITIVATEVGNWQRDQGVTITENWLTAYGEDIDAVVANNDEMALGAVEVLQRAGREMLSFLVLTSPRMPRLLFRRSMAGSVRQDLGGQGAGGVQIAYDPFNGGVTEIPYDPLCADYSRRCRSILNLMCKPDCRMQR